MMAFHLPERGEEAYDQATDDIWAFGMQLTHSLTHNRYDDALCDMQTRSRAILQLKKIIS